MSFRNIDNYGDWLRDFLVVVVETYFREFDDMHQESVQNVQYL